MKFWLNRVGVWAYPIIDVAETALDARIYLNNQSLEGTANQEKNLTSTVQEYVIDVSALMHKHWEDCFQSGRLLVRQIRHSSSVVKSRKIRAKRKSKGDRRPKESQMKRGKKSNAVKSMLEKWEKKMKKNPQDGQRSRRHQIQGKVEAIKVDGFE